MLLNSGSPTAKQTKSQVRHCAVSISVFFFFLFLHCRSYMSTESWSVAADSWFTLAEWLDAFGKI